MYLLCRGSASLSSAEYLNLPRVCSIPLPPPMSTTEGTTSGFDVEQGQCTDLSFIHNCLVLTPSVDDGSFFAQSDDNGSFAYSLPFANEDSFRSSSSSSEGSGQPEEDQGRPGKSNFSDGSEPLFSMYLRRTEEEDRKTAKSWKGYADGMLVFVSLRAPSHSSRIT